MLTHLSFKRRFLLVRAKHQFNIFTVITFGINATRSQWQFLCVFGSHEVTLLLSGNLIIIMKFMHFSIFYYIIDSGLHPVGQ